MVWAILLHGQMGKLRLGAESWWDVEQGQMKGVGRVRFRGPVSGRRCIPHAQRKLPGRPNLWAVV